MSGSVAIEDKVSDVQYKIKGPLPYVFDQIASIFRDYHPWGYGTRVRSIDTDDYSGDYVATMIRAKSCE